MWSFLKRQREGHRDIVSVSGRRKRMSPAMMETMEGRVLMSGTYIGQIGPVNTPNQTSIEARLSNGNIVVAGGVNNTWPVDLPITEFTTSGTTAASNSLNVSSLPGSTYIVDPRLIAMKQAPDGYVWLLLTDWDVANHQGFTLVRLDPTKSNLDPHYFPYPMISSPNDVETEWANDMTFWQYGTSSQYDILVAGGIGYVSGSSYEDNNLGWYKNKGIISAITPSGGLDTSWNSTGTPGYYEYSTGILGQIAFNSSIDSSNLYATEIVNGASGYSSASVQVVPIAVSTGVAGTAISASTLGFSSLATPFGIGLYTLSGGGTYLAVGAFNNTTSSSGRVDWFNVGTASLVTNVTGLNMGTSYFPTLAVDPSNGDVGVGADAYAYLYDNTGSLQRSVATVGSTNTQILLDSSDNMLVTSLVSSSGNTYVDLYQD